MRAEAVPLVPVATLLDSFVIGGVYTLSPRGGYSGGSSYARSPEKEQYAGTVRGHPTGLELPVGLPVRILAAGSYTSHATAAFQHDYCAVYGASDPVCTIASFTYTVHGLANGPGVTSPYAPGTGLMLAWSRTAGYYERFYGLFPTGEFFRGRVPASDTATRRELYFHRAGCCYYIPWGTTAAWETYAGHWRFGAVPDDGARAELGEAPVLRLTGPRTDAPMAAPATFTVTTTTVDSITTTRWWFIRAANNTFDGEPVPLVTITQPFTLQVPRYPDGQRAVFEEVPACAGNTTCSYQATATGAVVVQVTLADGRVLAARNTGKSGAHVRITVDDTTLTYGDTTVFRVTAQGATQWSVTGYSFVPLAAMELSARRAIRASYALRATEMASSARRGSSTSTQGVERSPAGKALDAASPARKRSSTQFRDAAFACSEAMTELCYDDPAQTGYEIVTAVVDGATQRDSALVTVLPKLMLVCKNPNGETDANGGTTVVRTQIVRCRASLAPEGSTDRVTVTDWTFVSHDRWIIRRRRDLGETFMPDSLAWTGPVVATGTVTVLATIGGTRSDSASARIMVRPRLWTKDSIPGFPVLPTVVGQGWLPAMPNSAPDLGQIRWWWRSAGDTAWNERFSERINDGPNAFVFYLKTMPPVLDSIHVAYNAVALTRNSAFYLAQEPDNPARIFTGANPCYRSDVVSTDTKDKILAHEGTKWELTPLSHAGRMRQLTFERVPAAAESVFVQVEPVGVAGLADRWDELVYKAVEVKIDSIAGKPVHSVSTIHFGAGSRGCNFVYPLP